MTSIYQNENVVNEQAVLLRMRRLGRAYRGHIRQDGSEKASEHLHNLIGRMEQTLSKDYILIRTQQPRLFFSKLVLSSIRGNLEGFFMPIKK